jgi:2-keto-4-pentenoate hydratase/2-oxohepta-3-ene-1,7-dioic acid hydratase in catechol pathway
VGRNYREHAAELDNDVPEEPMLFLKPPSALIGPDRAIELPAGAEPIHYEGELVLVIGRRCRHLDDAGARSAILGVTCGNDVSSRSLQAKDKQWGRAKGFDTFAPVGPAIATGVDPSSLRLETRLNGQVRQQGMSSQMIFDVFTLLKFITSVMTLEAGDVVFTGTPSGIGPLQPGDLVEVDVGGVGTLRNPVVAATASE